MTTDTILDQLIPQETRDLAYAAGMIEMGQPVDENLRAKLQEIRKAAAAATGPIQPLLRDLIDSLAKEAANRDHRAQQLFLKEKSERQSKP